MSRKLIKVYPVDEDLILDNDLYIYRYRTGDNGAEILNAVVERYYEAYDIDDPFEYERDFGPSYHIKEYAIPNDCEVFVFRPLENLDEVRAYKVPNSVADPVDYVLDRYAHVQKENEFFESYLYDGLGDKFFNEENDFTMSNEEIERAFNEFFDGNEEFIEQYSDYIINHNEDVEFTEDFILFCSKKLLKEDPKWKYFTIEMVKENDIEPVQVVFKQDRDGAVRYL